MKPRYVRYVGPEPEMIRQRFLWLGDFIAPGSSAKMRKLLAETQRKVIFVPIHHTEFIK